MSVAPAQASDSPEPLIFGSSTAIPSQSVLQPIEASVQLPDTSVEVDPLLSVPDGDEPVEQPVLVTPKPTGDLAAKVAALRGSDHR